MCSRVHVVSQNLGHALHIIRNKHILLLLVVLSILSYVIRIAGQKKVHRPTQIFSNYKFVFLRQISETHVKNRAQERHRFDELDHCSPLLFARSRRPGGFAFIHDILFFHVLCKCSCPFRQRGPHRFSLLQRCLHISYALCLWNRLPYIQLVLGLFCR